MKKGDLLVYSTDGKIECFPGPDFGGHSSRPGVLVVDAEGNELAFKGAKVKCEKERTPKVNNVSNPKKLKRRL